MPHAAIGGWVSSAVNTAANTGASWVIPSTAAPPISANVGTLACPPSWLTASAATAPVATPVDSAGVSMPPTAPARMNNAVSSGFNTIASAIEPNVSAPVRVSKMMLLPLPGSCGSQIDDVPVIRPANPTVMISVGDFGGVLGFARSTSQLKTVPISSPSGIAAIANSRTFQLYSVCGHAKVGAPWLIGHAARVAMLDVAMATSTASGCQLFSTMPRANNTPAAGTL